MNPCGGRYVRFRRFEGHGFDFGIALREGDVETLLFAGAAEALIDRCEVDGAVVGYGRVGFERVRFGR